MTSPRRPSSGNYTLTASPATPSFAQGGDATVVITVNRTGGFAGAVALSVTGAANGLTAALSTASTTGTTDTLTLTASATATVGAQTLTVKGTVAGLTDQTVTVQPTITAQTTSGNVTWQFCGRLGIPIFVAFQDGTGAWTHVTGTNDSYTFNITQAVGGVAYVLPFSTGGFDLEVFYGSKADLQGRANEVCSGAAGAGKTVTAAVAGTSAGDFVLGSLGTSARRVQRDVADVLQRAERQRRSRHRPLGARDQRHVVLAQPREDDHSPKPEPGRGQRARDGRFRRDRRRSRR